MAFDRFANERAQFLFVHKFTARLKPDINVLTSTP
jgi:hypothetical protein